MLKDGCEKTLTWETLVELEPRLAHLRAMASRVRDDGRAAYFCANASWFGYDGHRGIKPQLEKLVGFYRTASDPSGLLTGSQAYDLAYDTLYGLLPDCRGKCGCLRA